MLSHFWRGKTLHGKNKYIYCGQGSANSGNVSLKFEVNSTLITFSCINERTRAFLNRQSCEEWMEHCKPERRARSISNSMVSREIWKKYALMGFSKTTNSTRHSDSCYFEVFEKLIRVHVSCSWQRFSNWESDLALRLHCVCTGYPSLSHKNLYRSDK